MEIIRTSAYAAARTVCQLAALDAGGGADTFNRGSVAQGPQSLRCQRAKGAPGALEFVNLSNQRQEFLRDLYCIGFLHILGRITRSDTHIHPKV